MILTQHKKRIADRRQYIYDAYSDNEKQKQTGDKSQYVPVSVLVDNLANKFKISTVQVYNDIKAIKSTLTP